MLSGICHDWGSPLLAVFERRHKFHCCSGSTYHTRTLTRLSKMLYMVDSAMNEVLYHLHYIKSHVSGPDC